ncbi:polypeptide N-acetylgalactosaminyltransferase 5-like [Physella acuta]|uniref:polypeptide N-acetylgalactosaminyltransferase 5-like n=1 Tax=Physella acuta TaxID=109671 RepID=UPI0027DC7203|nr:polypeptide N-acetylgalactosaminyltransferase 5-like [Physella acuta]XP_059164208.1 polypeptide N-acetylgalactosaminyltransferase 5-like [Physella acuta]
MRPHCRLFRALMVLAVVWSGAMLFSLYAGVMEIAQTGGENQANFPGGVLREVTETSNVTAEKIAQLLADDMLIAEHLANLLSQNDTIKNRFVAWFLPKLNPTTPQPTPTTPQPTPTTPEPQSTTTKKKNAFDELRVLWPPIAKPEDNGYGGAGVKIDPTTLTPREKKIFDQGYQIYKVNQLASDRIPLRRQITLDMPECKNKTFDVGQLPTAGVVLIFTNEIWSVLLRTVYSILDAGPVELISEIVLVDDASDKEFLGAPLEEYIKIFGGRVKLVRLPERRGLIEARVVGFEHVTGSVAVFLDAHCEVHKGWLEPLLERIKHDDKILAVPNTDRINYDTFQYEFARNPHQRGGFEFDMYYSWIDPPPPPDGKIRMSEADPVKSPTHLGCCFAVSKANFDRLGRYDPGLDIWGCENQELSFKTWMCGGSIEIVPCSHVGHMYRPTFPYTWGDKPFTLQRNCMRIAEVWMDDYKKVYQDRLGDIRGKLDIGDVSARRDLRNRLQCQSFDWFVKVVYPELYIPYNTSATGWVSSLVDPGVCLTREVHWNSAGQPAGVARCDAWNAHQHFFLSKESQIRRDNGCLDYNKSTNQIVANFCHGTKAQWVYTPQNTIKLLEADLCVALTPDKQTVVMATCNVTDTLQQWNWPRRTPFDPV